MSLNIRAPSQFLFNFLELLPQKGKILDVACGSGRNSVALALKGFEVMGIDSSETAIQTAEQLARESGVSVLFKKIDLDFYLPDLLTFDAILCIDFRPPLTLLKNLNRGLKQHGILLMEASLMGTKGKEIFECFKPNELLSQLSPATMPGFQFLYYSELSPGKWGEKVFLIAKKSQFL